MTAFFADKKSLLLSLLLVAAGIGTYANSFDGPFIFDDEDSIPTNVYIRQLWPPSYLFNASVNSTVAGRPIVSLTLALNYAISGYEVFSYHAFNLLIHILVGLLLYGIVRRTLVSERLKDQFGKHSSILAWAIATIWLVHPLQTESVTYIVQRTESLMGLFYLLTLYAALRAMQSQRAAAWSVLSVVCCGFGMATKEVMVTAPVLVLIYDRTFFSGSLVSAFRRRRLFYLTLGATWVILALLMVTGPRTESVGFTLGSGVFDYASSQCIMVARYLRLIFWPHPLVLDYGQAGTVDLGPALGRAVLLAVLAIATLLALFRKAALGFAGVWFFLILLPTSSIVPIATEVGAERRVYLSSAGIIALVVLVGYVLLRKVANRLKTRQAAWGSGIGILLIILASLAWGTTRRNNDYRSAESIWRSSVAALPANPRAHFNLGEILHSQGRLDEAVAQYREAIELEPDFVQAHTNIGVVLESLGRLDEAVEHFKEALRVEPENADVHYNLALLLGRQGKLKEAVNYFQKAAEFAPADAEIHYDLGLTLKVLGRVDQAISHYRRAIEIDADYADAHNSLGTALAAAGKLDEAIHHFRQVLRINPSDAEANYNLALALKLQGRDESAVEYFRKAVAVEPDYVAALNELADILANCPDPKIRKPNEAIGYAERAARLTDYKEPEILATLADCYAVAGRSDKAVQVAQRALDLAQAEGYTGLAASLRKKLERYRSGRTH